MGDGLSSEFRRLLSERKLLRIKPDRRLVLKEIEASKSDLADARDSLRAGKVKWATVQGYYSMFHGGRALVFSMGFREKSHYAILVALRHLFANDLGMSLIDNFGEAMDLRQEADYGLKFSDENASSVIANAEELLQRVLEILKLRRER